MESINLNTEHLTLKPDNGQEQPQMDTDQWDKAEIWKTEN